ncbi:DUF6526 family protein [Chitinophaga horti]|uniref:DUF6526 family protein n=1 Tax=Chitinophaga horti TaxID=2920382 RepID=A0ABY6J838_9BACT|nr:DUF6526 family protein [Chitinophaga horti]UYQ94314.1 DUF6526 family protein [Chitinophaga horti]
MQAQHFKNHVRYYPPHHFVFYPVVLAGIVLSIIAYTRQGALEWLFVCLLFVLAGWLGFMMRQHYALTLQDRIVRQEVRFRYYTLTQTRFEILEPQLSLPQILALRFASDLELPALVTRAIKERMSPTDIKKAIKDWQGDYMRV